MTGRRTLLLIPASTNWIFELDDSRKRIAVAGFDEWRVIDDDYLQQVVAA